MMKRGVRPIRHIGYYSVFNRIKMQIVEVVLIIDFVTPRMFPKSPLPNAATSIAQARCGYRLFGTTQSQPVLSEVFLMLPQCLE